MKPTFTLEVFKSNLNKDLYNSATGARRAIGRATAFSDEDRTKAASLVDKHFGSDEKKAPKKAAAASDKPKNKGGRPKGYSPKTGKIMTPSETSAVAKPKGKAGRPKGYSPKKAAKAAIGTAPTQSTDAVSTAMHVISGSGQALAAVTAAAREFGGSHFSTTATELDNTISLAAKLVGKALEDNSVTQELASHSIVNGATAAASAPLS